MFQRKKWWEVVSTEKENALFKILSRSDKYKWRTMDSVARKLDIEDPDELDKLLSVFVKNRMILIRKTDKGVIYIGYWENVEADQEHCSCNKESFEDSGDQFDPNVI